MPMKKKVSASTAVYAAVRRKRMELVTEDVPETADGVDETAREIGIDFLAELFDVDVDGVGFDVFVEAPDCFDDGGAGDGTIGATHRGVRAGGTLWA